MCGPEPGPGEGGERGSRGTRGWGERAECISRRAHWRGVRGADFSPPPLVQAPGARLRGDCLAEGERSGVGLGDERRGRLGGHSVGR